MTTITADIARAVTPPPGVPGRPHRWTREEYMRLGEAGGFDSKVELLDGVIVDKWSEGETLDERRHRWTREEYERIAENGGFDNLRVELIYGEVVEKRSPQGSRHVAVTHVVAEQLQSVIGDEHTIRIQSPLALGEHTEPEPDVAIVIGAPFDFADGHPTHAELVVEIADTSLRSDRALKARAYAAANIPEYWIVNLVEDLLEIHRDPSEGGYLWKQAFRSGDSVSPLVAPGAAILVADILP